MIRWEYQTLAVRPPWLHALDEAGADGWELVALLSWGDSEFRAVFKRPLATRTTP